MKALHRIFGNDTAMVFANEQYRQLPVNYDNFFSVDKKRMQLDQPLLPQVQRISFELSNLCNYSHCHKKCPASRVVTPKSLPAAVVRKSLLELSSIAYSGVIAFHRYNEPLADPRLFSFIQMARETCPRSKILILTNGFFLTQQLADELETLGIWILAVSAYSKNEFTRLSGIQTKLPYKVFRSILDSRENIYDCSPLDLHSPCTAPICDLTINVDGNVCLCCMDWQNRHEFGSVSEKTLTEILSSQACREIATELNNANRRLDICRRCHLAR